MDTSAQLDARLREALEDECLLRLAVLFGSWAEGTARPDSDVDVAVIPTDPDLPLQEELALQARLEAACGRRVDLVRLDRASTLLRFQVASKGRVLLSRPPSERARFIASAASDYGDFAPSLRRAAELYRRRLVSAEHRGRPSGGGTER